MSDEPDTKALIFMALGRAVMELNELSKVRTQRNYTGLAKARKQARSRIVSLARELFRLQSPQAHQSPQEPAPKLPR